MKILTKIDNDLYNYILDNEGNQRNEYDSISLLAEFIIQILISNERKIYTNVGEYIFNIIVSFIYIYDKTSEFSIDRLRKSFTEFMYIFIIRCLKDNININFLLNNDNSYKQIFSSFTINKEGNFMEDKIYKILDLHFNKYIYLSDLLMDAIMHYNTKLPPWYVIYFNQNITNKKFQHIFTIILDWIGYNRYIDINITGCSIIVNMDSLICSKENILYLLEIFEMSSCSVIFIGSELRRPGEWIKDDTIQTYDRPSKYKYIPPYVNMNNKDDLSKLLICNPFDIADIYPTRFPRSRW